MAILSGLAALAGKAITAIGGSKILGTIVDIGKSAILRKVSSKWLGFDMPTGGTSSAPQEEGTSGAPHPTDQLMYRPPGYYQSVGYPSVEQTMARFGRPMPNVRRVPEYTLGEGELTPSEMVAQPPPSYGRRGAYIRPILYAASQNTGRPVTSRMIYNHIRQFGFQASSAFFGLDMPSLSHIFLHVGRRRRRRWTKNDLLRGAAYLRTMKKNKEKYEHMVGRRTYRRKSTTSGARNIQTCR